MVCVPTSFNEITADELSDYGFNIVIYANQLMRSSYKAMHNTALDILKFNRTKEIEENLISVPEILRLIPGTGMMIDPFGLNELKWNDIRYFSGVPDSLMKSFCKTLEKI